MYYSTKLISPGLRCVEGKVKKFIQTYKRKTTLL
jgi:hypothetical protein